MNLVTIASLIMVALFLLLFLKIGANVSDIFFKSESKNALKVSELQNNLYFLESATASQGYDMALSLTDKDLFLFFSAGAGPIQLVKKGGTTKDNLIFLRPDNEACKGTACICHCGGGPYWKVTGDDILIQHLFLGQPYSCPEFFLTCEQASDEHAFFVNSRGEHAFYTSVSASTRSTNSENDLYYPIPFDVLLLAQTTLQGKGVVKEYSAFVQRGTHVENLLKNYEWQGGVAIGGTGMPLAKKNKIESAKVIFRMEKYADFVYGVCLHEKCVFTGKSDWAINANVSAQARDYAKTLAIEQLTQLQELSRSCFSTTLSSAQQTICQEQLSQFGFSAKPKADSLYFETLTLFSFQHLFLLKFTSLNNDQWRITPELLVTSSCQQPEFISILSEEPQTIYLPLVLQGNDAVKEFYLLHKETADDNNITYFLSTKNSTEICSVLQAYVPPVFDLQNPSFEGQPSALTYAKLVSSPHRATIDYALALPTITFKPTTIS